MNININTIIINNTNINTNTRTNISINTIINTNINTNTRTRINTNTSTLKTHIGHTYRIEGERVSVNRDGGTRASSGRWYLGASICDRRVLAFNPFAVAEPNRSIVFVED